MRSTQLESVKQHDNKRPCINPAAPLICCGCSICWQRCFGNRAASLGRRTAGRERRRKEPRAPLTQSWGPFLRSQGTWSHAAGAKALKKTRWLDSRVGKERQDGGEVESTYTLKLSQQAAVGGEKPPEWVRGWMGVNWNETAELAAASSSSPQEADVSYLSWRHESRGCSNTMRRSKWHCFSLLRATGIAPFPILIAADSVFPTDVRCFLYLHRSMWD